MVQASYLIVAHGSLEFLRDHQSPDEAMQARNATPLLEERFRSRISDRRDRLHFNKISFQNASLGATVLVRK